MMVWPVVKHQQKGGLQNLHLPTINAHRISMQKRSLNDATAQRFGADDVAKRVQGIRYVR